MADVNQEAKKESRTTLSFFEGLLIAITVYFYGAWEG